MFVLPSPPGSDVEVPISNVTVFGDRVKLNEGHSVLIRRDIREHMLSLSPSAT